MESTQSRPTVSNGERERDPIELDTHELHNLGGGAVVGYFKEGSSIWLIKDKGFLKAYRTSYRKKYYKTEPQLTGAVWKFALTVRHCVIFVDHQNKYADSNILNLVR